ncbi:hypothetical protein [Amycolatopsis suaedae]|uniref:Phage tail protein n=1 Tax=Amycolatopsis suaedae TaxID=2510978 RepID=A0A4Q7IY17_9PSEU|nr:hypothetical protein [Amycolatopsis suaedae]RZQ59317.1 hypothetical protein EWH70_34580 [Amycolatopsis suaedae]
MAKSMRLELYIGGVDAPAASAELMDALQSVTVNTGAGTQGGFQLNFAVSKRSVITRKLLPNGFFDPARRVIIATVIGGVETVLMDGIITRQEMAPSETPGASTLTVTGLDLTAVMDILHFQVPWPVMPWELRVMAICAKYAMYGLVPVAVRPVALFQRGPLEGFDVQYGTDLDYVNALANVAGYTFFIEPGDRVGVNTAYWGPEARFGAVQPALTVNMGPATSVESMSFSFDGLSSTGYSIVLVEPNSKVGVSVPVPSVSLLRPPLAARPAFTLKHQPAVPPGQMSLTESGVYGLSLTARGNDAISGQGKLDVLRYGHVLKARKLVGVRGAGEAYDGLYYVKTVNHELKRGEYTQTFTLTRDGLTPFSDEVAL